MLRLVAWLNERRPFPVAVRYGIAVASFTTAYAIVFLFQAFKLRDPYALTFLAALWVTAWYGGEGPGYLGLALGTLGLTYSLHTQDNWQRLVQHNFAVYGAFFLLAFLILWFCRQRRQIESSLKQSRDRLEAEVQVRTVDLSSVNAQLARVNMEYKTIFDALPFAIALFDPGRVVRRCNPAYEVMTSWKTEELIGKVAPLPASEMSIWREQEEGLRAGRPFFDHEGPRFRKDGSEFPASVSAVPLFGEDGAYVGLVGWIVDTTQRRLQEVERQMFTALVQHNPGFIGVADTNGAAVFVNPFGQRLFGLEGDDHVKRTNVLEFFAESERARGEREIIPKIVSLGHLEFETLGKNFATSQTFPLQCTGFVIPDAKTGIPAFIAAVAQDITERKEAETRLMMSLEENRRLLEENRVLQEKLQRENISLQERNLALQSEIADIQRTRFEKIIGDSPTIRRTLSKVEQVAATDVTVLITGETGTGKELIAQAIHENSRRAGMPFRAINCAALPATLMAAELFGHEKGAFTGAERLRLGQFELANGGTLFLDEIAEIPIETQAMLLRVLEERGFERLGGSKLINSDVRIIAATNRDLHVAMQRGEFREDLFFRLNAFRIEMPPLRERKEDIPLLVERFVQVSAAHHGKTIRSIEKEAMETLLAYRWPGNVRELRNVIETSVIISPGEELVIDEELLFGSPVVEKMNSGTLEAKVAEYERSLIERALTETHGRVSGPSGAATLLGMPASTLTARIRVHKIDVVKFKIQSE